MAVTLYFLLAGCLLQVTNAVRIPLHRGLKEASPHAGRSLQTLNETEQAVYDSRDSYYYASVSFGTPPQPTNLLLDLSRAWTWVPAASCGNPCSTPSSFDPLLSTSYIATPTYRELDFDTGFVTGFVVNDSVAIGNENDGYVTAPTMTFLLVDYIWGNVGMPFDGSLGLAFSTYLSGAATYMDTLYDYGIINRRVFSLYFGDFNFRGEGENSMLTIGEYDAYEYSDNNLIFLPVYKPVGLWSLQLTGASMADTPIGLTTDIAVLNSTSRHISMPPSEAVQVFAALSDAGACGVSEMGPLLCDCGMAYSINSYPDIILTLGKRTIFNLKPTDYFLETQEGCYALIDGNAPGNWVLGLPFLRAYYTVYDIDNQQVGLAGSIYGACARAMAMAGLLLLWSA